MSLRWCDYHKKSFLFFHLDTVTLYQGLWLSHVVETQNVIFNNIIRHKNMFPGVEEWKPVVLLCSYIK